MHWHCLVAFNLSISNTVAQMTWKHQAITWFILSKIFRKLNLSAILSKPQCDKSYFPMWCHRYWSIIALIMACCLTTPSHYLKQCWLRIVDIHHNLQLNHWGRVTLICVGESTIIGSDNGLSPGWRKAIIWTSAGILLIWPLGTNFSKILVGIRTLSFKKMHLKMPSAK